MSIASELTALAANKAAIKAAIEAKNPSTMPTDALSQWPTSIASIGGGGHEGWIYGYVIDESDSNPATRVTYIEDNADFDPLYMDFTNDALVWGDWQDFVEEYFRPAMLTSAGVIDYYLDPNDLTKKADGVTASDVANTSYDGNAMLIVKPIFYNATRNGDGNIEVRFSNVKQGDGWHCWTHMKSDGTYSDFCGWPLFAGSVISSKMRSIATGATPVCGNTFSASYSYATANGSGWYTTTWADEMMMRMLFPLLCRSTDSQATIGGGSTHGSLSRTLGALSDKGYFWGNSSVNTSMAYGCKFLCMEDIWGEQWRRPCGIVSTYGELLIKLTPSAVDGSTANSFVSSATLSDYTNGYLRPKVFCPPSVSQAAIIAMNAHALAPLLPNFATGTDYSVFYTDSFASNTNGNLRAVALGGSFYDGNKGGIFCTAVDADLGSTSNYFNSSLSYHFY